mmetsp:Transcript_177/g.231  ORF Transcript_177/g.231 Transcript_177/m.231 type:complete len:241 (-) Transcript_177:223-945(-)|eukprot:CAMPEP_0197246496 /NCGR_PEP_ID=MMETSP1429-20130617/13422_1 /TAXON_ID=49237 /ORGANISM="Chaetoceros  sp., Strain UNC1202" /LENGTH=240 /DNA_ID=CAMNT_0042707161 /DNA_START=80 /DNA_END=802 /DNA_ORIENTATION=+
MKLNTTIALLTTAIVGSSTVSAFTNPTAGRSLDTSLRFSDETLDEIPQDPVCLTSYRLNRQSKAIPFMRRPEILNGVMAGDVGFDPLGLAKDEATLTTFREAEIKHGRLAMLAAAGWPLSELLDRKIAGLLSLVPAVDSSDRAPSMWNSFGDINSNYWFGVIAFAAAVDAYGTFRSFQNDPNYFPGNLGFDPLSLYPEDQEGQKKMQLAEIKHGRTAMVVFVIYAMEEFLTTGNLFPFPS